MFNSITSVNKSFLINPDGSYTETTLWQHSPCMIENAMREEMKKPVWLRNFAFMISCPCPKCNPISM